VLQRSNINLQHNFAIIYSIILSLNEGILKVLIAAEMDAFQRLKTRFLPLKHIKLKKQKKFVLVFYTLKKSGNKCI